MADDDPLTCLPLQPGERVLWTGRAAVGACWPSWGRLFAAAGLLGGLGVLAWTGGGSPAAVLGAIVVLFGGTFLAVVMASKLVGPTYVSLTALVLLGVAFGLPWAGAVWTRGWGDAAAGVHPLLAVALAAVVVPCLLRIAWVLLTRLGTRFLITDRRVAAVSLRGRAPRLLWDCRHEGPGGLRVVESWLTPGAVLFVGYRELDGHELHLRDDDPERVLDELRRALAERPA